MMRYKRPDRKNALSLLQAASQKMKFTLTLKASDESAATIIRNVYECFRMLGDALLIARGFEPQDHARSMRELLELQVQTARPVQLLENLRHLRHNVNYYGYLPQKAEADDAISLARACFGPLHAAIAQEADFHAN